MNRKILPPTIVAVTLTIILGLLYSIQLFAASGMDAEATAPALSAADADFTVEPLNQGRFTSASSVAVFKITIKNAGDAPTDTYELDLNSNWPAALFGPDGSTTLTDTNGSGGIDTDVVLQGESFTITARVDTPSDAVIADANSALLMVRSTISPSLAYTADMRSAVPAPFAQTLYQQPNRSINLLMSQPNASWRSQTSPDNWYEVTTRYPDMALAETTSGYFNLWTNLRYISPTWRAELEFLFTDKPGQPVTGISKLTNHDLVTMETLDAMPAVAIAPNGNIGVSWYRTTRQIDDSRLYNVYLAILDPTGQPITDTINLTNNSHWRDPLQPEFDVPSFGSPRIAATGDDHFFVAWESSIVTYTEKITKTYDLSDIYYAIYASDGVSVTQPIKISNNVSGTRSFYPAMTSVNTDRVFLSWAQRRPAAQGGDDILYTVIDSNNVIQKSESPMANDGVPVEWSNFDVVRLSSGEIIAAWEAFGCDGYAWSPRIRYAVFRSNNYNRVGQPACLPSTVVAEGGDQGVSLVPDNRGRVIVTWTDRDDAKRRHLYYALLGANGNVATEPMIYYANAPADGLLSTGLHGYASATRIFLDLGVTINPSLRQGASTDPVSFTLDFRNNGALTGTGAVMTLTLAPGLSYQADNAPSPPTISGQDIVWALGDALPWSQGSFDVTIAISPTILMLQAHPLTVTIAVDGQEATMANNVDSASIVIKRPLFVPWVVGPG